MIYPDLLHVAAFVSKFDSGLLTASIDRITKSLLHVKVAQLWY